MAYQKFEAALNNQQIGYAQLDTRPSPMNTVLWSANVETEDAYLLGNYSFFDTRPISFVSYPKNHKLLGELIENEKVQRMIRISEGWYIVTKENGQLYFNDLRFGLLSFAPNSQDLVFKYKIDTDSSGEVTFSEQPKGTRDGKKMIKELWERMRGN